jgi:predicted aspartyl protease
MAAGRARPFLVALLALTICIAISPGGAMSPVQPAESWAAVAPAESVDVGAANRASAVIQAPGRSLRDLPWPDGTLIIPFENLEGAILVQVKLTSTDGRDTAGVMVLDTGAGFVGVDALLARWLGISDTAAPRNTVGLSSRPLARLGVGSWQVDQVSPVLTVDAAIIGRMTGRPVLGLLGQALFWDRVVVIDYLEGAIAILPPEPAPEPNSTVLKSALSSRAVAVPFRLAGDGKAVVVVSAGGRRAGRRELRLIVDTGATKSVFFRPRLDQAIPGWETWPRLVGLGAPTMTGDAAAEVTRVPEVRIGDEPHSVERLEMDAAVLGGDLGRVLAADVGEPVDGLLGYSFLKHYRVAFDYPRAMLWLDPAQGDVPDRSYEFSTPGVQLEMVSGRVVVFAVASRSPAALAGIRVGDEVTSIDGRSIAQDDLVATTQRLEGPPGSTVILVLRRGQRVWSVRLIRRQLL